MMSGIASAVEKFGKFQVSAVFGRLLFYSESKKSRLKVEMLNGSPPEMKNLNNSF